MTPTDRSTALTRTVVALGIVSLLTDAASDMVWPLLPVFLTAHLHRSIAYAGMIEGIAEATAAVGKYLAGRYSDRVPRKKPLVLAGYGLSSAARPLLALALTPWHALAVRFLDRVGKGMRTAPRDAIIASTTPPDRRGAAFGFHRAMDNLGAVIGPLAAWLYLRAYPGQLRGLFTLSLVPGALAVLALLVLVREAPAATTITTSAPRPGSGADPGPDFRRYLAIVALFTLANASDFFLLPKAREAGVAEHDLPIVWGALSLLRAVAATPGGWLADRIGRPRALALGWALYAAVYSGLAYARTPWAIAACLLAYGMYYGLTEGAERALVASFAPPDALGRAYGMFALVTGLAAVPSSTLFGALYEVGPVPGRWAFLLYGAIAALASLAMWGWSARRRAAVETG
jgi:MFS family permease